MGCWNATCAITNLPIFDREEVYAILLGQNDPKDDRFNYVSYCHPTELWRPMGWFFTGTYNDYGSLEDCGGLFKNNLELVRNALVELDVGKNKCHDIEVKKHLMVNEKFFFEANYENRLCINTYAKINLKCVYIKKTVFEGIINGYKHKCYDFEDTKKNIDIRDYVRKDLNKHLEEMQKFDGNMRMIMRDRCHSLRTIFEFNIYEMSDAYYTAIEDGRPDLVAKYEEQIMWYNILSAFMNNGRMMWCPPSGEGSQDQESTAQRLRAELTLKTADEVDNYYEDYEDAD